MVASLPGGPNATYHEPKKHKSEGHFDETQISVTIRYQIGGGSSPGGSVAMGSDAGSAAGGSSRSPSC